ncbi:hypothetical protein DMN91_006532 [Ooceraea biroi]|uniref:DUF4773 domain-containing protein n=2 Tax=Ooceraea biroi TaxID=2015173 RepID=A0A3L8DPI8_OOCBI|nr:hypothetical protein DMN91_006532 [Ooceraea biroi]
MEWDEVSLNGTLCANASYLQHEYGISMTLTFNKWTIINETVSARNPPPICIGENIVDLEIEVCLHIYDIDIDIETNKFHACFEVLGRIMKLKFSKIKLGCVNTSLYEGVRCIENNIIHQLSNFKSVKAEQKMKAESTINSGAHNGITLDFILLLLSLHSFVLLYKILVTRTI